MIILLVLCFLSAGWPSQAHNVSLSWPLTPEVWEVGGCEAEIAVEVWGTHERDGKKKAKGNMRSGIKVTGSLHIISRSAYNYICIGLTSTLKSWSHVYQLYPTENIPPTAVCLQLSVLITCTI